MEKQQSIKISLAKVIGLLNPVICLICLIGMIIVTPNSDIYMIFILLLIVFSIPASLYLAGCIKDVFHGGFKYFLFSKQITPDEQLKIEKNTVEEEKRQRQKKELERKQKEKYSFPKLKPTLFIIPSLMSFGTLIFFLANNVLHLTESPFNIYTIIIGVLGVIGMFGFFIEDEWKCTLEIKREIFEENIEYKYYNNYDSSLIYMDNILAYLFLKFSKIITYLVNIIIISILIAIIINIVSSISIQPTTIIIFLLILIYLEVTKRRE